MFVNVIYGIYIILLFVTLIMVCQSETKVIVRRSSTIAKPILFTHISLPVLLIYFKFVYAYICMYGFIINAPTRT